MCSTFWLLMVLPMHTALAGIVVNVYVKDSANRPIVAAHGEIPEFIPDMERSIWGLEDKQLQDALQSYTGRRPEQVFYRSSSDPSDPYESYQKRPVTRTVAVVNAVVLNVTDEEGLYKRVDFDNLKGDESIIFEPQLSVQINQTVSSSWAVVSGLKPIEINYNLYLKAGRFSFSGKFSYTSNLGVNKFQSIPDTVGDKVGSTQTVLAHSSYTGLLKISRRTMKLEITYVITLSGAVAYYFRDNHNVQFASVNDLFKSVGSRTVLTAKEVVNIEYFSDLFTLSNWTILYKYTTEV